MNSLIRLFESIDISKSKFIKSLRYLLFIFIATIIFYFVKELIGFKSLEIKNNKTTVQYIYLLEAILLIPLIEEFIFRSYLSLNFKSIIISIFSCIAILCFSIIKDYKFLINTFPFLLFFLVMILILAKLELIKKDIKSNFFLLILSSLIFAFFHLNKLENIEYYNPVIYLNLFPSFIAGVGLGYTRLKLGLLYAIILHIMLNLPATLISFLSLIS